MEDSSCGFQRPDRSTITKNNCGRMNPDRAYQMTRENAEAQGYEPCKNVFKKRNETPQPDRAGNPSGCGVFLCFFLHKIAIEQKQTRKAEEVLDAKKEKAEKITPSAGRELLSAMQVPSDLAFGEPVVTFMAGEKCRLKITAGFWNIMRAASVCLRNTAGAAFVGRESGLFRIPGGDAGGRENRS